MRVGAADDSTQSSNIDVVEMTSWRIAVSLPSPDGAEHDVLLGVRPVADRREHLRRSSASLTGRPSWRAAIAASTTCDHTEPLQPKPPPTNGEITRTFSSAMPKRFASVLRQPKTPCVES